MTTTTTTTKTTVGARVPCVLCPWEPAGLPGLLERERAFLLPPGPGRCRHAIPCPETLACALELRGRPRGSAREGCAPWGERGRGASQALRDGAVCPPGCSGWLHAAWACPQVVRFSAWWSADPCGRGVGFPAPHVCSRHDPPRGSGAALPARMPGVATEAASAEASWDPAWSAPLPLVAQCAQRT